MHGLRSRRVDWTQVAPRGAKPRARWPHGLTHLSHQTGRNGFLPGTFEPEETLGDTTPAEFDALPERADDRSWRMGNRIVLVLCVATFVAIAVGFL